MRPSARNFGGSTAAANALLLTAGLGLGVALAATWLAMFGGCAKPAYLVAPQNPGDHCRDVCPEGMTCWVAAHSRSERPRPGTCVLLDGRCATSADCGPTGTCIRTSTRLGLCAPSPPHL